MLEAVESSRFLSVVVVVAHSSTVFASSDRVEVVYWCLNDRAVANGEHMLGAMDGRNLS